jgi:hypothetical protein
MQSLRGKWNLLLHIGGKMKLKVLLVLAVIGVAFMATESFARDTCYVATDTCRVCRTFVEGEPFGAIKQLDLGVCDTVRIGCPVCVNFSSVAVGDSFAVPIYIYNSHALSAVSLGFRHDGRGLKFGGSGGDSPGWDPTGGMLSSSRLGGIIWAVDTLPDGQPRSDSGTALMGWWDNAGTRPVARNTTNAARLLGTIWMVLTDSIRQTIRFDSLTFYPPAGNFIMTCRDSTPGGQGVGSEGCYLQRGNCSTLRHKFAGAGDQHKFASAEI